MKLPFSQHPKLGDKQIWYAWYPIETASGWIWLQYTNWVFQEKVSIDEHNGWFYQTKTWEWVYEPATRP